MSFNRLITFIKSS